MIAIFPGDSLAANLQGRKRKLDAIESASTGTQPILEPGAGPPQPPENGRAALHGNCLSFVEHRSSEFRHPRD